MRIAKHPLIVGALAFLSTQAADAPLGVAKASQNDASQIVSRATERTFAVTYLYHGLAPTGVGEECPTGLARSPDPKVVLKAQGLSPAEIDALTTKSENQETLRRLMTHRGPKGENICKNPTLAADPHLPIGQGAVGVGVDLDGGKPVKGCANRQLVSPQGVRGVDNQLSRVLACIGARRGTGYFPAYEVGLMRDGEYTILIKISGIDDDQNDNDVMVTLYSSPDPLVKDAVGKNILRNASFTADGRAETRHSFKASIRNGVLTTEAKDLTLPYNQHRHELALRRARMQLRFLPDGSLKGALGGYETWRTMYDQWAERGYGGEMSGGPFSCEGVYYALQKAADADFDPATGTCKDISAGYDIEAAPAFIIEPKNQIAAQAGG